MTESPQRNGVPIAVVAALCGGLIVVAIVVIGIVVARQDSESTSKEVVEATGGDEKSSTTPTSVQPPEPSAPSEECGEGCLADSATLPSLDLSVLTFPSYFLSGTCHSFDNEFEAGTQVTVTNETGVIVGAGSLGPPYLSGDQKWCVFRANLVLQHANFYQIGVAERPPYTVSDSELAAYNYEYTLTFN